MKLISETFQISHPPPVCADFLIVRVRVNRFLKERWIYFRRNPQDIAKDIKEILQKSWIFSLKFDSWFCTIGDCLSLCAWSRVRSDVEQIWIRFCKKTIWNISWRNLKDFENWKWNIIEYTPENAKLNRFLERNS